MNTIVSVRREAIGIPFEVAAGMIIGNGKCGLDEREAFARAT